MNEIRQNLSTPRQSINGGGIYQFNKTDDIFKLEYQFDMIVSNNVLSRQQFINIYVTTLTFY